MMGPSARIKRLRPPPLAPSTGESDLEDVPSFVGDKRSEAAGRRCGESRPRADTPAQPMAAKRSSHQECDTITRHTRPTVPRREGYERTSTTLPMGDSSLSEQNVERLPVDPSHSSPVSVPVLDPKASASMPRFWSTETKRFESGALSSALNAKWLP